MLQHSGLIFAVRFSLVDITLRGKNFETCLHSLDHGRAFCRLYWP
jgi:hypothetical protein